MRKRFVFVLLAVAALTGLAAQRAMSESNCPSLPYSCAVYQNCQPIKWCVSSVNCNAFQPNREVMKTRYIQRCTYMSYEVFCSSCSAPTTTGLCCSTITTPPSCPTGTTCQ